MNAGFSNAQIDQATPQRAGLGMSAFLSILILASLTLELLLLPG